MIKDTNPDYKNAQNRLQSSKNGGFLRIFILILIVIALLLYFELDPMKVWEKVFEPVLTWLFDLILRIIEFLYGVALWIINTARNFLSI
jgi:hypothetical protein